MSSTNLGRRRRQPSASVASTMKVTTAQGGPGTDCSVPQ
jgi:hypothetical protein